MKKIISFMVLILIFVLSTTFADSWTTGTSGQITTQATTTKVGIGMTTAPQGQLQVNGSYIIALAPTGVAATDVANIRAAITAVNSGGVAGTVNLQAGTYVINQELVLPNSLKLVGAGMRKTIININNTAAIFGLNANNTQGVSIKDLTISSSQSRIHRGLSLGRATYSLLSAHQKYATCLI